MNPTHLRLVNVGRWDNVDVDLPAGTVALVGENGQGKSTFLNAIDAALFAERGELNDLITAGEDRLEIELTFEHAGELYRVRRQMKAGKSPNVDFERCSGGRFGCTLLDDAGETIVPANYIEQWEPLTRENATATTALICETLGLTRDTFRASSFLKQGDTAAFTEADPAARKALLAKGILRLDLWDDATSKKPATTASMVGLARADLREAEAKLPAIDARIEACGQTIQQRDGVERTLDAYRTQLQTAIDELVVAEAALERAQQAKAGNEAAAERLRACKAELDAATAALSRAQAELATSADAAKRVEWLNIEIPELATAIETIPTLEQQLEKHRAVTIKTAERNSVLAEIRQRTEARDRLVDEALGLNDQARDARDKASRLLSDLHDAGLCDRCGQTLGVEAARRAAQSFTAEAEQLEARARHLDEETATALETIAELDARAAAIEIPEVEGDSVQLEVQLGRARSAIENHAKLSEQLAQATEAAAKHETLRTVCSLADVNVLAARAAVDEARSNVLDEDDLANDVRVNHHRVNSCRNAEQVARDAIARTEQTLEQIAAAAAELEALTGERAMLQERVRRLRMGVDAYGRNGTPALYVEAIAVPQIEAEANRLLALMPTVDGTTFQIELRTQRELKGSEELRDTLDIVVFDGEHERRYETYSGGEQGRLNLCLRVALADLLRSRRGAESRLLAIDEIPYMDGLGQDEIVEILAHQVADKFDRIYVIGHTETFQQSFDQTIRIVKRGGRSVVEAAPVEVAA